MTGLFWAAILAAGVPAYLWIGYRLIARRYTTWRAGRLLRTFPQWKSQWARESAANGALIVTPVWPLVVTAWVLGRALKGVSVVLGGLRGHLVSAAPVGAIERDKRIKEMEDLNGLTSVLSDLRNFFTPAGGKENH